MRIEFQIKIVRKILVVLGVYRWLMKGFRRKKFSRIINDKGRRNITFLVYQSAVWKSDSVVNALRKIPDVELTVTIAPIFENGEYNIAEQKRAIAFFEKKNISVNVIDTKDSNFQVLWRLRKIETIVFSDCWNLSASIWYYYFLLFKDVVYIPYSHQVSKYGDYQAQYNQIFHNFMRCIYAPHEYEVEIFDQYSNTSADNVKFFGYPGVEALILASTSADEKENIFPKSPWDKFSCNEAVKLIWAPHHSVDWVDRRYSTFLETHGLMREFAIEFREKVNICFKPHPMLRATLNRIWGITETDAYFSFWESQSNTFAAYGNYEALFAHSDVLLHDSGSFLAEYLYTGKPHLYLLSSPEIIKYFNDFGLLCLNYVTQISDLDNLKKILYETMEGVQNQTTSSEELSPFTNDLRDKSKNAGMRIAADILGGPNL